MVANNQRGRHQGEQLVAVLHHGKMPCGCPLCAKSGLSAVFAGTRLLKYWCPVNRIDNVYGDRHLLCTCTA